MANPTNADIMLRLGKIEEVVTDVRNQAIKTNGRVTELEKQFYIKQGYEEAIKDKKKDKQFDITTIIALIAAVGVVIGAMWWLGN